MPKAVSKIFVINLEGSNDRWDASQAQLIDCNYERVEAVNGERLSLEAFHQHFDKDLNHQQYHKVLTKGEIGCYLSHRKVWKKIVDEKLDFALVLEDDFVSGESISGLIDEVSQIHQPWDCIKLTEHPIKRKVIYSEQVVQSALITYNKVPAKTCAQFISYAGAQKLLAASEKFGRPVDVDIQHWWESGLRVFGLKPYPFEINQNVDSDIEHKGQRKKSKTRRIFKWYKQILFYFKNKRHTAILLSKN